MTYRDLKTHLKIRVQEAQANATQQVEAIALAVSMVLGGDKKNSSSSSSEAVTYEDAAGLEQGLAALMRGG